MTTHPDEQTSGLTRRHLIAGGAAAAAGAALIGTAVGTGNAGAKAPAAFAPQALDPAIAGLTYKAIDAAGLDVYANEGGGAGNNYRIYQDITGSQPIKPNTGLYASLDLPVGAVIKQINAVYQNQPIVSIRERNFATGAITDIFTPTSMTASPGGAFASSVDVTPNVVIKPACSYVLKFFCVAGCSIMGATVGYSPAAFAPFAGAPAAARVLDTRVAGGKFDAGEERVLDLSGATPIGTAVVLNLTADQPEGTGFLSAYSADIAFPGTSSLNYSPATPNIANTTTVVLGAGNKIKLRAGEARTHVIADVVGYLL